MSRKLFTLLGSTLLLLSMSFGCATTIVDLNRIPTVEKVAIVGFQGVYNVKDPYERKKSSLTKALNVANELVRDVSGDEDRQLRKALNYSYDQLIEVLSAQTDLRFLSRQEVVRNTWYRSELKSRGRTPGFDLTTVDEVIGYPLLRNMSADEREMFMTELGVDSIAIARLIWLTGSTQEAGWAGAMPGGKRIRPAANVELITWQRGAAEPIWHEKGIRGCPTKDGIEDLAGFALTPNMAPILKEASDRGYTALIDRYRQAAASAGGSVGITMDTMAGTLKCDYSK